MVLGWGENPANRLLVLPLTVQITACSTFFFWSPLILTSPRSSVSFSFSPQHTHWFCLRQISHQILLTDCGKEMSGPISVRLLRPFLMDIVSGYLVWCWMLRFDSCCSSDHLVSGHVGPYHAWFYQRKKTLREGLRFCFFKSVPILMHLRPKPHHKIAGS